MFNLKATGKLLGTIVPLALLIGASTLQAAEICAATGGYMPQPRPMPSTITTSADGDVTYLTTGVFAETDGALFPESDPDSFGPNPTNLLPTLYADACDSDGQRIPNTLPSTPENPYNLQENTVFSAIDGRSPQDDLDAILDHLDEVTSNFKDKDRDDRDDRDHRKDRDSKKKKRVKLDLDKIQFAIDILEGNPVDRAYSGFPLLHYNGPNKVKTVDPVTKTVTVNQIWSGGNIESDTSYIDPSNVMDEEWTVHYVVNVLNRGHEDFAPYSMVFDKGFGQANVGLDQTFFPMEEGLRYEFDIKQVPGKIWNLTYHWGWRVHPPRVQVQENVLVPLGGRPRNFAEIAVFGPTPTASEADKLAAIDMIGDLSPAKRMWRAMRSLKQGKLKQKQIKALTREARNAFYDWQDRTALPSGVKADPDADVTLFYVNNTIYGHVNGYVRDSQMEMQKFKRAGDKVIVKLLNGDYYLHTYVLVDFGGSRGWENTFHNTLASGGAGPWFTFGRNHFWIQTTSGAIPIPPATRPEVLLGSSTKNHKRDKSMHDSMKEFKHDAHSSAWNKISRDGVANKHRLLDGLGEHKVEVTFTYEPSPRLRMYQFDALHHDVAVWSMH